MHTYSRRYVQLKPVRWLLEDSAPSRLVGCQGCIGFWNELLVRMLNSPAYRWSKPTSVHNQECCRADSKVRMTPVRCWKCWFSSVDHRYAEVDATQLAYSVSICLQGVGFAHFAGNVTKCGSQADMIANRKHLRWYGYCFHFFLGMSSSARSFDRWLWGIMQQNLVFFNGMWEDLRLRRGVVNRGAGIMRFRWSLPIYFSYRWI